MNDVIVTVTEKVTISPIYYLFAFFNKELKQFSYCFGTISESFNYSRNKFQIEEKSNPIALNGQVELVAGEYEYTIYEKSHPNDTDTTGLNVLEFGNCSVAGTYTANTEYSAAYTNTTYEP